jgi:hypothetical protein
MWDLSFVLTYLNAECDVHLDTVRTPVLDGFFFCSKTPGKGTQERGERVSIFSISQSAICGITIG